MQKQSQVHSKGLVVKNHTEVVGRMKKYIYGVYKFYLLEYTNFHKNHAQNELNRPHNDWIILSRQNQA
jgi:hypothetical protein